MSKERAQTSFRAHIIKEGTSPLFLSLYLVLLTIFITLIVPGELEFGITLCIFYYLFVTMIKSFITYRQTGIREFLFFGLILFVLILISTFNCLFIILQLFLLEYFDVGIIIHLQPKFIFSYLSLYMSGPPLHVGLELSQYPLLEILYNILNQQIILGFFIHFSFSLYFMRSIWISFPKSVLIFAAILLGCILFGWVFQFGFFTALVLLVQLLFTYFILGLKMYHSIRPIKPTPRVITATKIWRIIFISYFAFVSFTIVGFVLYLLENFIFQTSLETSFIYLPYSEIFTNPTFYSLLILLILTLLSHIAISYPENLLIFESHLVRAKEIYDRLDKITPEQLDAALSLKNIVDYLKQIPSEYFK
ncbi:MAG: hypothetical protein ACFFAE_07725 [Candidatus Hodarchaeota archaeon]